MTRFHVCLATLASLSATTPSFAHPGSHQGMAFGELVDHLSSGWHLVLLIAVGLAVLGLAVAAQRRSERQASLRRPVGGDR